MFEGFIAGKLANKMFEKDVFKIVKKHAFIGAIVMILPLFGFDWLIYCIVLWHMYHAICEKVGTKLDLGKHTCELVEKCIKMGYKGVAITDHNGCQAFPIAYGIISSYNK